MMSIVLCLRVVISIHIQVGIAQVLVKEADYILRRLSYIISFPPFCFQLLLMTPISHTLTELC